MAKDYPVIDADYDIELDDPDDPMAMPIAQGRVDDLHDKVLPGRYTGTAMDHEGSEVPIHVMVAQRSTVASHVDDVHGPAHPDRGKARRALVEEMNQVDDGPPSEDLQLD